MDLIFANNAVSSLAGSIANTATTIQLQAGTGILFPQPLPGQYFVGTFTDAGTGLLNEIVWVTQVVGDTLTIQRAKEGTQPQAWSANDLFAELWTAGQCFQMLQQGQAQFQLSNYAVDVGVANAYRVTLNPALAQPVAGMPIRVKITNGNTGPSTLDPGPGPAPIVSVLGLPLTGGELQPGMVIDFVWNGATYNLQQPTVQGVPTGSMAPFAGNVAPAGWLRCDGQAVSRTTYAALFTVIGVIYGAGDGVNTFLLPDMRGRVAAHLDGGVGRLTNATMAPNGNTLGAAGGQQSESAAVSITSLAGNVDVGVSVSGGISGSTSGSLGVTATAYLPCYGSGNSGSGTSFALPINGQQIDSNGATSGALSVGGSFSGSGSGSGNIRAGTGSGAGTTATVSNVQPTLVLLYIIKA